MPEEPRRPVGRAETPEEQRFRELVAGLKENFEYLAGLGLTDGSLRVTPGTLQAFPFAANWGNRGGSWRDCAYWLDGTGTVHLTGLATKTGTPAAADVIGTLPAGFRPSEDLVFGVNTGEGIAAGRVDVEADGDVVWQAGSTGETDYVSLAGISFRQEQ